MNNIIFGFALILIATVALVIHQSINKVPFDIGNVILIATTVWGMFLGGLNIGKSL